MQYQIVYNEEFQPICIQSIKDNWPNLLDTVTIVPLGLDDTKDIIINTIKRMKDIQSPQE